MDRKYAIFDMDGTLIDSMTFWARLAPEYLEKQGVHPTPQELAPIGQMTMAQSCAYLHDLYSLKPKPDQMARDMNEMMEAHYRRDIPLKRGVREYLQALRKQGALLCVASATETALCEVCLERTGVRSCFSFIVSCETIGKSKQEPDIYLLAAQKLAALSNRVSIPLSQIAVYEDSLYCARTAHEAGFYTVGFYDAAMAGRWEKMKTLCDVCYDNWQQALDDLAERR